MSKQPSKTQLVLTHPISLLAFGFGTGLSRHAPGTCGTLIAVPFYYLLHTLPLICYSAILLLAMITGIWICAIAENHIGVPDDPGIVWDEICGYGLTMLAAPQGMLWIVLGFILFRIFDIWKPWPIRQIDRTLKGGVGIMLDDIVAASYAWLSLQTLYLLLS